MTVTWTLIAAAVTLAAGTVAFVTALINHRTARLGSRSALALAAVPGAPPPEPKILLPARTYFVNRDAEMREAEERIRGGEALLTIEGDIGIGKSAAATELAYRLRSTTPGGTPAQDLRDHTFIWIDARDACPSLVDVCRALSTLTGNQYLSTVADDEKLDALRAHLASNKTVLVLDNLRLDDDPECEAIRTLLRRVPHGSRVIAAINSPGALPAARVPLGDLAPVDILALIHHEARRLSLDDATLFDEAFAARLQAALGGNPGMIEWFLRALSRSAQSVEERLEAVERGEGLEELLAPVWSRLGDDARALLAACAHLRGQANAEQLAVACALDPARVASALEELIAAGFVGTVRTTGGPSVATCAPAVQSFISAQTSDDARATFTIRLADHFSGYFGRHWEDAHSAIPHVDALRAVIEELGRKGPDVELQRLFRATYDILMTLGLFDDRIYQGDLAYKSAIRAANYRAASLACSVVSSTRAIRGEFAEALEALAHGVIAAERDGTPAEIARQQRDKGFIAYRSGDPEGALASVEDADWLAREGGDLNNMVDVLGLRMSSYLYLGALDDAERVAHSYLRACEEIPWQRAQANPLRHLAEIAIHRGQFDRARELLDRGRTIAVEYEDRRAIARQNLTEARFHLMRGRPRAAIRIAALAEAELRGLGLPPEAREAGAVKRAAVRASVLPPLRLYYARRRPTRLTDAPVGGD